MPAASAADNAAAVRRHRAHRRGDHSLCLPYRPCRTGEPGVPAVPSPPQAPPPVRPPIPELRAEGPRDAWRRNVEAVALWDELSPQLGAAHKAVLLEACRAVERLDRLDRLIDGRYRRGDWLRLTEGEGGELRVVVDDLLTEARQQQAGLKGLIAELRMALPKGATSKAPAPTAASGAPTRKGGKLGDLSARLAERRAAAAG